MTTSCALDSPALCTRTIASAVAPGTGASRDSKETIVSAFRKLRTAAYRETGNVRSDRRQLE